MNTNITCCKEQIELKTGNDKGQDLKYYLCPICGKKGKGKTGTIAKMEFDKSEPDKIETLPALPNKKTELVNWANDHLPRLMKSSATFIDKPATRRMIEKTVNYVARLPKLDAVWACQEGKESIIRAIEEAFWYGATLPDMGSIVPFGKIVEFIPAVQAFNFALTTGKSSPFEWTTIECIFQNDLYKQSRKNGEFMLEFESIPADRGDVIAVAVYGFDKKRKITIGDVYSKDRLIEKAKQHSTSYKYFIQDVMAVKAARVEGKIEKKDGMEFIVRKMFKRDGTPYNKTIWIDEMSHPYEGADQPEMLRKIAGKTFFRPWMSIRNALEMAGEWTEEEIMNDDMEIIDTALNRAKEQVKPDSNIQDADYEEIDEEDRI